MVSPVYFGTGPVDGITDSCYVVFADHSSGASPLSCGYGADGCYSSHRSRRKAVEVIGVEPTGEWL